jgi:DNA-binding transcriptional regulator PaaX
VGAQGVSARAAELIGVIAKNGCSINEAEMNELFPANGFERTEVRPMLREFVSQGILEAIGERLFLRGENCETPKLSEEALAGAMRLDADLDILLTNFVGVFAAHGCVLATRGENAIPSAELMAMFAGVGIGESQVAELATSLLDSGRATVELETDAVTILPPLCIAEMME